MPPDDNYAIILHNVRTYRSAGVVIVVRGKRRAEEMLKEYESAQSSADHHAGWRYFVEKTSIAAGTNAAEATNLRQAELDRRESRELGNEPPGPNTHN